MEQLDTLIRQSLQEDMAAQDVTALACVDEGSSATARLYVKAEGVLSGIAVAARCFALHDHRLDVQCLKDDGDHVQAGDLVMLVSGSTRSLLAAERTALNFLQRLSGIATATWQLVRLIADTDCCITDTRKTTPGLRHLEKQAVLHGGGVNHRMDLAQAVLIKENHIAACGSITDAVHACYAAGHELFIEVECETLAQVEEAVAVAPDMILLDNMDVATVAKARAMVPPSILLEASGNISHQTAAAYAATGVDRLAVGAITHSAPALDLSLLIEHARAA